MPRHHRHRRARGGLGLLLALPLLAGCALLDDLHTDDDGSEISYPACFRVDMPPDHAAAFEAALMEWNAATGFEWFAASDPGCPHEARTVPNGALGHDGFTKVHDGKAAVLIEEPPSWKPARSVGHIAKHEAGHVMRLEFENSTDPSHAATGGAVMSIPIGNAITAVDLLAAQRRIQEIE